MPRFHTVELSDPAFERDGLRTATVKSRALGRRADVTLWVPPAEDIGTMLILLHGVYGSHWLWTQKGGVHRTAGRLLAARDIAPMVIAMPGDSLTRDGSAYLTWPGHEDVERWIVDEVPAIARLAAPALRPDASVAIAGLSMGGYGALRLGAKYAARFKAISAHSAITGIAQMGGFVEEPISEYMRCAPADELSPLHWLCVNRRSLPHLRFDCGIDDPLISANRDLHAALDEEGIDHVFEQHPGGHHWDYWQTHVERTLRFTDLHCRQGDGRHAASRRP